MTRLRTAPLTVPGWVHGVVQDAEPGTLALGSLAEGENLVPTPAGRLRIRGGSRIVATLHDDQATPAEITHVTALHPFTAVGALAIGWSEVQAKHYAWRLTQAMAFVTGAEATSRHDLTAAPSTAWDNADGPARPVMAEVFERMFLADATEDYATRNTLLAITNDGTVTQPAFQFGSGAASPLRPYCLEEYNGVLFIAGYGTEDPGDGDRPEMLRHSFLGKSPDAADGFDADAWLLLGAKGQRITALRKGRGLLLAAKRNEFWRIGGSGRAYPGWQYAVEAVQNTQGLGVSNPNALIYAEGYWWGLGEQGPLRTDGYAVESLVGPRLRGWRGIDRPEHAWVAYHPERRLVLFGLHPTEAVPGRSATYPWRIWAWDVDRDVWQPDLVFGADFFFAAAIPPVDAGSAAGPPAPTAAPSSPVTSNVTASGYTASWTPGDPAAETEFWEKEGTGGTWTLVTVLAPGVSSYARTGRTTHTAYAWRVRHRKSGIYSAYSAEEVARTLILPPSLSGCGQLAVGTDVRLSLTQHAGGTDVVIERSDDGVSGWTEIRTKPAQPQGTFTEYFDTGFNRYFRAKAVDATWPVPESIYSPVVQITDVCGA